MVRKIILHAFKSLLDNSAALAKALTIPFILFLFLSALQWFDLYIGIHYLLYFLGIGLQLVFAITTHRIILIGPDAIPKWGLNKWTSRETVFIFHALAIMLFKLIMNFAQYLPESIRIEGGWVCMLIAFWLIGRLSLVLPSIAIDQKISFDDSWKLTRNYQGLMIFIVGFYPLLVGTATIMVTFSSSIVFPTLLNFFPFELETPLASFILEIYKDLLTSSLHMIALVFQVSALSVVFKAIYQENHRNEDEAKKRSTR